MNKLLKQIKDDSLKNQNSTEEIKKVFNKRYIIKEKLAKGGLCEVYKVEDIYDLHFNTNSNLVIKIPNKQTMKNKDIATLLFSEYTFLRELTHPNIVRVFDFGIDKKTKIPYLVLEHLKGKLLSQVTIYDMQKSFKRRIFKTLINTIEYIHSKDIIHADINPSNIIVDEKTEKITVIDFGISTSLNNSTIHLDYNKVKAFNPDYSAPEVLEGKTPSKTSDIFSLASVLYEIYTSSLPKIKNNKVTLDNFDKLPFFLKNWFNKNLSTNLSNRTLKYCNNYNKIVKFLYFK